MLSANMKNRATERAYERTAGSIARLLGLVCCIGVVVAFYGISSTDIVFSSPNIRAHEMQGVEDGARDDAYYKETRAKAQTENQRWEMIADAAATEAAEARAEGTAEAAAEAAAEATAEAEADAEAEAAALAPVLSPLSLNLQLLNCGRHLQSAGSDTLDSALACWEDTVRGASSTLHAVSGTDGQVTSQQPFCRSLANLAAQPHVELALELGTWKGGGSSLCMGKAFARTAGRLITVEFVIDMWLQARKTLAPYPVACVLGATIPTASLPTQAEVIAGGGLTGSPAEETPKQVATWSGWLAADRKGAEAQPEGLAVLEPLCKANVFDLVVLDGGEFSGIPDWAAIERNQVLAEWDGATGEWTKGIRYVAMDDTRTYKNRAVFKEFTASSDWTLLDGDQAERNGWAIFERAKGTKAVAVLRANEGRPRFFGAARQTPEN